MFKICPTKAYRQPQTTQIVEGNNGMDFWKHKTQVLFQNKNKQTKNYQVIFCIKIKQNNEDYP